MPLNANQVFWLSWLPLPTFTHFYQSSPHSLHGTPIIDSKHPSPIQSRQSSEVVYTARRSYGKARQSTPITDSVKSEQRGLEQRWTQSPVNSLSLSLSLSLKVRDWKSSNVLFWFRGRGTTTAFPLLFSFFLYFFSLFSFNSKFILKKKKKPHENSVVLVCLTPTVTDL